ncbi:MAG TPA: serine/threonine-protein kinase [Gemmatimonadales bacterium]|jgi:serine/threonine-protein kinase|nr:serine/threonine-protein kinase [Gemmatimonadales bacterium]
MDLAVLQERLQAALGSEFTVGPLLGQGGFAAVFRVKDTTLNRDVAVKVLDVELAPSPTLAERFIREALTIARLEHAHIVPIYKVGRHEEVLYIIMRCIDGASLRQLLGTHRRLSVGDAARIARQVADALAYAHSHEIVHRDIKPDNILLDRTGHVLVTDFGIAKAAQAAQAASATQLTTEGMIIGTPQYMSPEQASGDKVDGRSDIYSLGIVLYQMLAGGPPFDGDSSASILAKQLTQDPPPLRRDRPDLSEELSFVLDRMLEKEPARRFQTAKELSRALIDALPTAARDHVRVPLRRRLRSMALKSLIGLGVAGCLAFVAFVAGAAVVAYTVFSKAPKVVANEPIADSLARTLRERRALASGDTAEYAFQPGGSEDTTMLLVTRRRTVVLTPHQVRSYRRDTIEASIYPDLRGGLFFRLVLRRPERQAGDTVYRYLSFRDFLELAPRLAKLEQDMQGGGIRVRTGRTGAGVRVTPRR